MVAVKGFRIFDKQLFFDLNSMIEFINRNQHFDF